MAKDDKDKKLSLVKMTRSEQDAQGGPTAADVHPDEVDNFKKGGWRVVEK